MCERVKAAEKMEFEMFDWPAYHMYIFPKRTSRTWPVVIPRPRRVSLASWFIAESNFCRKFYPKVGKYTA